MNRPSDDKAWLEAQIKETDAKQLLASELMTRIRNKAFANSHGRLAQTGDWICLQLLVEAMEETLKSRQARDQRALFLENHAVITDRFELLALTLLLAMHQARLKLPEGLTDSRDALERLQRYELGKVLRREIGSAEELNSWTSGSVKTDRFDVLAENVRVNVLTWDSAHVAVVELGGARPPLNPPGRTRFIAEFLRTELGQGLPSASGTPFQT